jgi:hypothetical protein
MEKMSLKIQKLDTAYSMRVNDSFNLLINSLVSFSLGLVVKLISISVLYFRIIDREI